jgi:hypothetical protein
MQALLGMILIGLTLINASITMVSVPAAAHSETELAEFAVEAGPPWADCGIGLECLR